VFARVGNGDAAPHLGISTDGGKNWYAGQEPAGVSGGGTIAVGADANAMVWSPAGAAPVYSTTRGSSWTASAGLSAGVTVESDRVNPKTFYAYGPSGFATSKDGGARFTASTAALPGTGTAHFHAVPGHEGDVWFAGSTGLLHSIDGGATFARTAGVDSAINVAFGKAAPGSAYPAVFLIGTVGGVAGVFRSDDGGAAWIRINDDAHRYGNAGEALAGDPRVYGRVYLGTNGRGILYADRTGGTPTTSPGTPTPTRPTPGPTSPTPGPTTPVPTTPAPTTPGPTPTGGARCTATYKVTGEWSGGFQGEVTVKNTGTAATRAWTAGWNFAAGQTLGQVWNGTGSQSGAAVTVHDAGWNGVLAPGASTTFGFLASFTAANPVPSPLTCTA
jgi:cellulase/cellobiase CelA1